MPSGFVLWQEAPIAHVAPSIVHCGSSFELPPAHAETVNARAMARIKRIRPTVTELDGELKKLYEPRALRRELDAHVEAGARGEALAVCLAARTSASRSTASTKRASSSRRRTPRRSCASRHPAVRQIRGGREAAGNRERRFRVDGRRPAPFPRTQGTAARRRERCRRRCHEPAAAPIGL